MLGNPLMLTLEFTLKFAWQNRCSLQIL